MPFTATLHRLLELKTGHDLLKVQGPALCLSVAAEECRLTRWVNMQEADPVTRPLQNHLPLFTHFTTQEAL